MKSLLLLSVILFLPVLSYGQITFEEVIGPEDFNIGSIRQSPTGEYFIQALNDKRSIYTSLNGQDWTRTELPFLTFLDDIQFFSDGTPVLKPESDEHLIRRNGTWYRMRISAGSEYSEASFIKDDSLFIYQNETFAYSLDKGKTFTTIFTFGETILDNSVHLWKFENHFVLYHTAGASEYLSVFNRAGNRVLYEPLHLSISDITYNSCGEILIYDNSAYYRLKEQGLAFTFGNIAGIHPDFNSSSELMSRDGHYYFRYGSIIYETTGCNFTWQTFASNDLIQSKEELWINHQGDIFLFDLRSNYFVKQASGTNVWEKHTPDINHALISRVNESAQGHQFALTSNALFSKHINDENWILKDTSVLSHFQVQYSPDGGIYVNRKTDLLYSSDNGENFSIIDIPQGQVPFTDYHMEVLDNNILFIADRFLGSYYYTVNNGKDWIYAHVNSALEIPLVKLVDNYILIAVLEYAEGVTRINISTNESAFLGLANAYSLGSSVMQDDGTIYYYGFEIGGSNPEGLYRFRFGEELEFVGQFPELESIISLASSGTNLYGFGLNEYYSINGTTMTTHNYIGLPSQGSKSFIVSENEYLYALVDNHTIFRSTRPLSFPQHITGSIYNHKNQDCVADTSDATLMSWQVKVESNEYLRITTTDDDGNFNFSVPRGEYTLSSKPINDHWDLCENSFNITIDENIEKVTRDFLALTLTDCAQLEIDFSTPLLRRCFENYYSIQVRNTGPKNSDGTTLTLKLDPFFEFISASIPYTLVGDSIVRFDLGILAVNDEISFQIFFKLSCDVEIGIEHCLTGILDDAVECGDFRSTYTECQVNIGSYDPNDKRIFNEAGNEADRIDKNEYIYYHIRFQNTGTDTAFNIKVIDPLSSKLDLGTLEMLSSSHPYDYFISDGPSLVVTFENVLLVDSSTNEPASHGFFKFRVKPLAAIDYGTIIPNQADIYFDFNDPVLTNEATFVILPTVGTNDAIDLIDFNVFPNPVHNVLSLTIAESDMKRIDSYEIIDQLGHRINQSTFLNRNDIHVGHLAPGVYNLILKENGICIGMRKFVRL